MADAAQTEMDVDAFLPIVGARDDPLPATFGCGKVDPPTRETPSLGEP